jgi:DNA processing protein
MNSLSDADAMLLLSLTAGLGAVRLDRLLEGCGSARAILGAEAASIARIAQMSASAADAVKRSLDGLLAGPELQQQRELMARHGATLVTRCDAGYPRSLLLTPDPPAVLFVKGELREQDALALAIVGSRRCTHYGREQADRFAGMVCQAGMTIVSGGAFGIDAAAHRATLRAGGRTIAVLGNGLAKPYPEEHGELFDQIADGHGAVISEFPMQASPRPEHFPLRNRIISGLALGVLVVEAALRSGALITARLAAEDHGREVMAIPGRIDSAASAGCHKMIREGWATLVASPTDVLDCLGEAGQTLKATMPQDAGEGGKPGSAAAAPGLFDQTLTPEQRAILDAMGKPVSLDQVIAATQLPVSVVQAQVTLLQMRGMIERREGMLARRR